MFGHSFGCTLLTQIINNYSSGIELSGINLNKVIYIEGPMFNPRIFKPMVEMRSHAYDIINKNVFNFCANLGISVSYK